MDFNGIEFPNELFNKFKLGKVVIFAGAGVSLYEPSNCPSFEELARKIADGTGLKRGENQTIDNFLGMIASIGVDVKKEVVNLLQNSNSNHVHRAILRLFPSNDQIKIITTNFDLLFEKSADENDIVIPRIYSAPALPLGKNFKGLVHLHGDINNYDDIVIDEQSFGEAYITEGWASKFMKDVCLNYTTLFIGYSFNDTIMKYLIRSISNIGEQKYIITDNIAEAWENYGFRVIKFPKEEYDKLKTSLNDLSNYINFDYFDLQDKYKDILSVPPSNNSKELEYIRVFINDKLKIRIFTENAKDFSWVEWLKDDNKLDFLWNPNLILDKNQIVLSNWIVENFVEKDVNRIALLLGNKISLLHPVFCNYVILRLLKSDGNISQKDLNRWLVLLVNASKNIKNSITFFNLVNLGKKLNKFSFVWSNINRYSLSVSKFYSDNNDFYLDVKEVGNFDFKTEDFRIADSGDCHNIIYNCARDINNIYQVRVLCSNNLDPFDNESYFISAIENHPQNIDDLPLINCVALLRDTLIKLFDLDINAFRLWINILIKEKSKLLKRVALFVMANSSVDVNEKTRWFIKNIDIYDSYLHHEVYSFMGTYYSKSSKTLQNQLLKKMKKEMSLIEDENREHRLFKLLYWINLSAKDQKISKLLSSIKKHHPDYGIKPHLDFLHYHEVLEFEKAPWTKAEIKALIPSDFIVEINKYILNTLQGDYIGSHLSRLLSEIISEDIVWYTEVLKELADTKENCDTLKKIFVGQFENIEVPVDLLLNVLESIHKMSDNKLMFAKSEMWAYNKLIKYSDVRANPKVLNNIRNRVFEFNNELQESKDNYLINNNYVDTAINNLFGKITQFFIYDLRQEKIELQNSVSERYVNYFESVCRRNDFSGEMGKTIIGMNFPLFLSLMPEFVAKTLVPCLNEVNKGLWSGLLYPNFEIISDEVFKIILPYMDGLLQNKIYHSDEYIYNQLIKKYSFYIFYYTPYDTLFRDRISELYKSMHDGDGKLVLEVVKHILRCNEIEFKVDFWNSKLKNFLTNRVDNKPLRLSSQEAKGILNLAEYLYFVFDEYLEIIKQLPKTENEDCSNIVTRLNTDENLFKKFTPQQIGEFLIVFFNHISESQPWVFNDVKDLFDKIKPSIDRGLSEKIFLEGLKAGIDIREEQ